MNFVTLVKTRLATLGFAQKDLARAAQVAKDNDLADPDLVTPGSVLRLRFSDDETAALDDWMTEARGAQLAAE